MCGPHFVTKDIRTYVAGHDHLSKHAFDGKRSWLLTERLLRRSTLELQYTIFKTVGAANQPSTSLCQLHVLKMSKRGKKCGMILINNVLEYQ